MSLRCITGALVITILFISCTKNRGNGLEKHYSEDIFTETKHLLDHDSTDLAIPIIDSLYATFPAVSIADKYRYYMFRAESYNAANSKFGHMDSAILYTDSMLFVIEHSNRTKELPTEYAKAFNLKATYCITQHRYSEAFKAISMGKFINQQAGDSCMSGENTATLGVIAYKQGRFPEATVYFKEAVSLLRYCEDGRTRFYYMQGHLDNLGLSFYQAGQRDSALKYYQAAASYIINNMKLNADDPKFPYIALTVVYGNIASLFEDEKDYRNAEMYLEKNIAVYTDKITDSLALARCRMVLAELYLEENKIAEATGLFNTVKTQAPYFNRDNRVIWLRLGAALAQKNNNAAGELYFLKEYDLIKDSVADEAKQLLKEDPILEYERITKKHEIGLLEKNNRIQRNYTLAAVFIFLLSLSLAVVIFFSLKRSRRLVKVMKNLNNDLIAREQQLRELMIEEERRKEKERQNELAVQEMRLQVEYNEALVALRRKISDDMHDELSSSLAALRFYIDDIKDRKTNEHAKELLADISVEVNSIYENARRYMHNLRANAVEVQYNLVDFLTAISHKFSEKKLLYIELDIDADKIEIWLSNYQQNHLYHILRESISNIIKHAHATSVYISISFEENICHFMITDNGEGFDEEKIAHGLGLNSIRSRMEELGGSLHIHSDEKGTVLKGEFTVHA